MNNVNATLNAAGFFNCMLEQEQEM
jgi:hypothetical protein